MKKTRIIALFIALCMLATMVGIMPMAAAEKVALTKDNVVEVENGKGSEQFYFLDQKTSGGATWTTLEANSSNRIILDLKKEIQISTIKITYSNNGGGRIYGAKVYYATGSKAPAADDSAWAEIANTGSEFTQSGKTEGWWSDVTTPVEIPANVKARYIKVIGLGRTGTPGEGKQTNIGNLEIFTGTGASSDSSSEKTTTAVARVLEASEYTEKFANSMQNQTLSIDGAFDGKIANNAGEKWTTHSNHKGQADGTGDNFMVDGHKSDTILYGGAKFATNTVGSVKIYTDGRGVKSLKGVKVFKATKALSEYSQAEIDALPTYGNGTSGVNYSVSAEKIPNNTIGYAQLDFAAPIEADTVVAVFERKTSGADWINVYEIEVTLAPAKGNAAGSVVPPEAKEEEIVLPPIKLEERKATLVSVTESRVLTVDEYTEKFGNSAQRQTLTITGAFDGKIANNDGEKWTTHSNHKGQADGTGDNFMVDGHKSDTILYGGAKFAKNNVTSVKIYTDGRGVNSLKGVKVFKATKALSEYSQAEIDALPTYGNGTSGVNYSVSAEKIPNNTIGHAQFDFAKPIEADTVVAVFERRTTGADWINVYEIEVSVASKGKQEDTEANPEESALQAEKEIALLTHLGIVTGYEDGSFKPEEEITRAEFVTMIARMMQGRNQILSAPAQAPFPDVPASHWAAAYIKYGKDSGYLNGFNDGTFKPDEKVTCEQVIKVLVCTTGYEFMAKAYGGYPSGYITVASFNNILNGAKINGGANALRGQVAKLMYNTLFADLMTVSGISSNNATAQGGNSIIKTVFDVEKISGRVTASGITSLTTAGTAILNGQIEINGKEYDSLNLDDAYLLGYMVDAYIETDGNDKTILWMYANEKSEIVEIDEEDILSINDTFTKVTVEAGDDEKKYIIESDPYVVLNGIAYTKDVATLKDADFEKIILLSTDGDSRDYDTVFVLDYEYGVVSSISTAKESITYVHTQKDGTDVSKTIYCDDSENTVFLYKDGKPIEVDKIAKGERLAIAKNGPVYTIYVDGGTVQGKISRIKADYVTINGTEYKLLESAKHFEGLALGRKVVAYLTLDESIFCFDKDVEFASSLEYGLLMKAKINEDEELVIRAMNSNGIIRNYIIAENMKLNGFKIDKNDISYEEVLEELKSTSIAKIFNWNPATIEKNGRTYEQIMLFKTDSNGYITELVTSAANAEVTQGDKLASDIRTNTAIYAGYFSGDSFYRVSGATTFFVPFADEAGTDANYNVRTFGTGNRIGSYILYNTDKYGSVPVMLTFAEEEGFSTGKIAYTNPSAIITDVERVYELDSEGEYVETVSITFATTDGIQTYTLDPEAFVISTDSNRDTNYTTIIEEMDRLQLSKGDIVFFSTTSQGKIGGIHIKASMHGKASQFWIDPTDHRFDAVMEKLSTEEDKGFGWFYRGSSTSTKYEYYELMLGEITEISETLAIVDCNNKVVSTDTSSAKVYIYDVEEDEITEGSSSDLEAGDVVFVQRNYRNTRTILVIKNYE